MQSHIEKPQLKIINFQRTGDGYSHAFLIRQSFEGYRCESKIPLYKWQVT